MKGIISGFFVKSLRLPILGPRASRPPVSPARAGRDNAQLNKKALSALRRAGRPRSQCWHAGLQSVQV